MGLDSFMVWRLKGIIQGICVFRDFEALLQTPA